MADARRKNLLIITRRLVVFAGVSLVLAAILFSVNVVLQQRLMVSWLAFECGLIGGFVSIQQRIRRVDDAELALLAESWASILMIPIYGGIFALVLYVAFLAEILQGQLFPAFYVPTFADEPTTDDVRAFLMGTYPSTGADFAKLIFWSFVAGFSERFVPQIVGSVSRDVPRSEDVAGSQRPQSPEEQLETTAQAKPTKPR